MKIQELKGSLALKAEPIYLVSGEDAFFIEQAFVAICSAYLKEPEINLTAFSGEELKDNADALFTALTSYPFLSDKRIVAVREYYPTATELKALKSYSQNPLETTILVVMNREKSEQFLKLDGVCFVDCSKGDYTLLSSIIEKETKSAGVTITKPAVNRLIDACLSDMTKINSELSKLIAYAGEGREITEDDVFALSVKDEEYKLYEVVDLISRRDKDRAFKILSDMLSGADAQRLYSALYNHFRRLLYASIGGATTAEIAKSLGVKEYAVKKAKEQSARFSPKRLKAIVDKLAEYDASFKSGKVMQSFALWNGIMNVLIA